MVVGAEGWLLEQCVGRNAAGVEYSSSSRVEYSNSVRWNTAAIGVEYISSKKVVVLVERFHSSRLNWK